MRWRVWLPPSLACVFLLACQPPSSEAPGAVAALPERDASAWAEMERIERMAGAHEEENDARLHAMQARLAPGSGEQLEATSLRLAIAAHEHNGERAELLIRAAEQWPAGRLHKAAELLAAYGRALALRERGDIKGARKALPDLQAYAGADAGIPATLMLHAYLLAGRLLSETNAPDRAIGCGTEAIRISDAMGSTWRRAAALNELSWFYFRAQQLERAKAANSEAAVLAQADPSPALLFAVYNVRSILFADDANRAESLRLDGLTLAYARQSEDPALLALAIGNSADYYLKQHNFRRALELATEGLELSRHSHNVSGEEVSQSNIGLALIGLRRMDEGARLVKTAIGIMESRGDLRFAAEIWEELGNALEAAGDAAGA